VKSNSIWLEDNELDVGRHAAAAKRVPAFFNYAQMRRNSEGHIIF